MSENQAGNSKPFDPTEPFRGMRDAYLDAMSKAMVEAVNTEGYAQASGAMLDSALTITAPFRDAMEKSMLQVLQQLSLPSRQDIVGLAERFTNMEVRLDDLDAKLDNIEKLGKALLAAEPAAKAGQGKPAASANGSIASNGAAHGTASHKTAATKTAGMKTPSRGSATRRVASATPATHKRAKKEAR